MSERQIFACVSACMCVYERVTYRAFIMEFGIVQLQVLVLNIAGNAGHVPA